MPDYPPEPHFLRGDRVRVIETGEEGAIVGVTAFTILDEHEAWLYLIGEELYSEDELTLCEERPSEPG